MSTAPLNPALKPTFTTMESLGKKKNVFKDSDPAPYQKSTMPPKQWKKKRNKERQARASRKTNRK